MQAQTIRENIRAKVFPNDPWFSELADEHHRKLAIAINLVNHRLYWNCDNSQGLQTTEQFTSFW